LRPGSWQSAKPEQPTCSSYGESWERVNSSKICQKGKNCISGNFPLRRFDRNRAGVLSSKSKDTIEGRIQTYQLLTNSLSDAY
jgi:hypothetical protein